MKQAVVLMMLLVAGLAGCFGSGDVSDSDDADPSDGTPVLPSDLTMEGAEVVSYSNSSVTWRWVDTIGPGAWTPTTGPAAESVSTPFSMPAGLPVQLFVGLSWEDDGVTHLAVNIVDADGEVRCNEVRSNPRAPPRVHCSHHIDPLTQKEDWAVRVESYIGVRQNTAFEVELTLSTPMPNTPTSGSLDGLTPVTWKGLRTAPHPAYGYPTVNDPSLGLEVEPPQWWDPPAPEALPDPVSGLEHRAATGDGIDRGTGIALFGHLVVVPGMNEPTTVWDINDPEHPERLADLPGPAAQDAYFIAYPDGRLVTVLAPNSASIPVVDVTDPTRPDLITIIETDQQVHNLGVVPGTPILYTASSLGGGTQGVMQGQGSGSTEIWDLSDPTAPERVLDWSNGYGCHEITFHIDSANETYRAYCAGLEMTQIWDLADPLAPEVLVEVPVPHGTPGSPSAGIVYATFSHLAMVNHDASVLIVGDETSATLAPTCDAYVEAHDQTASGPGGNLWFYDLSDEQAPELVGWISPRNHLVDNPPHDDRPYDPSEIFPGPMACTAHFGSVIEDTGLLAFGYLKAGALLIDINDPARPRIVDQWNDNSYVWDMVYYQGYLFSGDYDRGLDVLSLTSPTRGALR